MFATLNLIKPYSNSFFFSNALIGTKRGEDISRNAKKLGSECFLQTMGNYFLYLHCKNLSNLTNSTLIEEYPFWTIAFTGPVLCFSSNLLEKLAAKDLKVLPKPALLWAKGKVDWIKSHVGSVYQLAAIVASIAAIYFGFYAYGSISFAILAFGYLERHRIMPKKICTIYHNVTPWLGLISGMLAKDLIIKMFCINDAYVRLKDLYARLMANLGKSVYGFEQISHFHHLTWEQYKQILESKSYPVEVDFNHLTIPTFSFYPAPNYKALETLVRDFCWDTGDAAEAWHLLYSKDLKEEEKEKVKKTYPAIPSEDKDKIRQQISHVAAEACHRLKDLLKEEKKEKVKKTYPAIPSDDKDKIQQQISYAIDSIKNEAFDVHYFVDYGLMQNYLGYIAAKLPTANYRVQCLVLLTLANQGKTSIAEIQSAVARAAFELLNHQLLSWPHADKLPLKQIVLFELQKQRNHIVETMQKEDELGQGPVTAANFFRGLKGAHLRNFFVNIHASNFGLLDEGAKHDPSAKPAMTERLGPYLDKKFYGAADCFQRYRPAKIITWTLISKLLDINDIRSYAESWVNEIQVPKEEKDLFLETLDQLTPHKLYKAMLLDMGILKIQQPKKSVTERVSSFVQTLRGYFKALTKA
jgi:hypothetical protein